MNITAKFQLHPPYGFWGDDFVYFLRKFSLSVAMATNQIQRFGQNYVFGRGLLDKHLWFFWPKYLQRDSNKCQFSFLPLQINGNFKLPSQRKHMSNGNKNIIFIEANVMNISAKFQLHLPNGFWGYDFFCVCANLAFRLLRQPIKFTGLNKIDCLVEDYLRKIYACKFFVKISAVR